MAFQKSPVAAPPGAASAAHSAASVAHSAASVAHSAASAAHSAASAAHSAASAAPSAASAAAAETAAAPTVAAPATGTELSITERAAEKIKTMLAAEQKDAATYGLRVGVRAGGCSGMSYWMGFDIKRDDDAVASLNGANVYCDPKSMQFISGSTLDYQDGLQGAGFTFVNPHAKGGCGCGSSFSV